MQAIQTIEIQDWHPSVDAAMGQQLLLALEQGKVLHLPRLAFAMQDKEQIFYSPQWLSGKRKNISLEANQVRGAVGEPEDLALIADMIGRYATQSASLINSLFPGYTQHLHQARTSFRPGKVEAALSWKKDDSRLHVDAFPSRPNHGERILRVFTNVNPSGAARVWRVGEPFADSALRFLPDIPRPLPGSAKLLHLLGITKRPRSEYDHIMLHLHDRMKADMAYQKSAPQQEVHFAPGSTWICYSDQVLHAAMSGQYMFEQTFHLPIAAQRHPQLSPLQVLERLKGRQLVG
jgi:hypothetical protein